MPAPIAESVKGRARVLRREGASIRQIAAALGVSKSAVGGWLRDTGEPLYIKTCGECGERFLSSRSHAQSCSPACRWERSRAA